MVDNGVKIYFDDLIVGGYQSIIIRARTDGYRSACARGAGADVYEGAKLEFWARINGTYISGAYIRFRKDYFEFNLKPTCVKYGISILKYIELFQKDFNNVELFIESITFKMQEQNFDFSQEGADASSVGLYTETSGSTGKIYGIVDVDSTKALKIISAQGSNNNGFRINFIEPIDTLKYKVHVNMKANKTLLYEYIMKYDLGLSSCGKTLDEKLFCAYKENGLTKIELSKNDYSQMNFKEVESLSEKYGVQLWSLHLPFMPFNEIDISSTDESLRTSTIKKCKDLIEKGSQIRIKNFIVHPSGEPIEEAEREDRLCQAKKSLKELAEIANLYGAVIAVEDLPRTCLGNCSREILELISVDDRLRVCFDTNHLLGEKPESFILAVGDKIITTHISDYDAINERHWLPGEGVIDWKTIIDSFDRINYKGPWLYEIGFGIPKTILRDRELTCADFAKNAKEIFEKENITVISKPKPNLGMWE